MWKTFPKKKEEGKGRHLASINKTHKWHKQTKKKVKRKKKEKKGV